MVFLSIYMHGKIINDGLGSRDLQTHSKWTIFIWENWVAV